MYVITPYASFDILQGSGHQVTNDNIHECFPLYLAFWQNLPIALLYLWFLFPRNPLMLGWPDGKQYTMNNEMKTEVLFS